MNLKRGICTMAVLMLICISIPVHVSAETRNIYIGDIINLEISSQKVSEEELRQKFRDFEIIELKKESGGYFLSIRTFEPGEYTVVVGDKELIISVGSTITDMQRDDIFEGELTVLEPGISFHWRILLWVTVGVFTASAGFILVQYIKRRKVKPESSYETFLRRSLALSDKDDSYFVDLTLYFKEYVEGVNKCRIIGKTTSEIVDELSAIHIPGDVLADIQKWLTECDVYKFTGMTVSDEVKHCHRERLLSLVKSLKEEHFQTIELLSAEAGRGYKNGSVRRSSKVP